MDQNTAARFARASWEMEECLTWLPYGGHDPKYDVYKGSQPEHFRSLLLSPTIHEAALCIRLQWDEWSELLLEAEDELIDATPLPYVEYGPVRLQKDLFSYKRPPVKRSTTAHGVAWQVLSDIDGEFWAGQPPHRSNFDGDDTEFANAVRDCIRANFELFMEIWKGFLWQPVEVDRLAIHLRRERLATVGNLKWDEETSGPTEEQMAKVRAAIEVCGSNASTKTIQGEAKQNRSVTLACLREFKARGLYTGKR